MDQTRHLGIQITFKQTTIRTVKINVLGNIVTDNEVGKMRRYLWPYKEDQAEIKIHTM